MKELRKEKVKLYKEIKTPKSSNNNIMNHVKKNSSPREMRNILKNIFYDSSDSISESSYSSSSYSSLSEWYPSNPNIKLEPNKSDHIVEQSIKINHHNDANKNKLIFDSHFLVFLT